MKQLERIAVERCYKPTTFGIVMNIVCIILLMYVNMAMYPTYVSYKYPTYVWWIIMAEFIVA